VDLRSSDMHWEFFLEMAWIMEFCPGASRIAGTLASPGVYQGITAFIRKIP